MNPNQEANPLAVHKSLQCHNFRRHGLPVLLAANAAFFGAAGFIVSEGIDARRDGSQTVVIRPDQEAAPLEYAERIRSGNVTSEDLAERIAPQASRQGEVGVDPADVLMLPQSQVDMQALGGQVIGLAASE